jgi:hypothetical protein
MEGFQPNDSHTYRLSEKEIKALGLPKKEDTNRYYLNQHRREKLKAMRSINDPQGKTQIEEKGDNRNYVYTGTLSIQDLETAVEFFNVDLKVWEVEKWVANSWDVNMKEGRRTNYQVKLWLKKKSVEVKTFVEQVKESLEGYEPPKFSISKKSSKYQSPDRCGVINLFDAHIDKFCIIGKGSLERNIEVFENSFDLLLDKAIKEGASTIVFPVGSDFWNTNVAVEATKKGTPQVNVRVADVDTFGQGTRLIRRCIDKAANFCNVYVIVLKGNHDEDKCLYAGELLSQIYENQSNVVVENSNRQRKYFEWGKCLLGFAHGDKEKSKINELPLVMAEEQKDAWARTTFREFYLGDIHHKQEYKFLRGKDFVGCMVRFLRSVSTSLDQWHDDFAWIGVPKTAELFV